MNESEVNELIKNYIKDNLKVVIYSEYQGYNSSTQVRVKLYLDEEEISDDWFYIYD